MKASPLALAAAMLAGAAFADAPSDLPVRETGQGETVSAFLGLCVRGETLDAREVMDRVRESGWTVFYEDVLAGEEDKDAGAYEAAASSRPGDVCALHVTLESTKSDELRCEVVVSQFCQRGPGGVRDTVLSKLSSADGLTLDPVSTADENRRLKDHEHQVYRARGGQGPLVRLADTGGTLYLSSVSTFRAK